MIYVVANQKGGVAKTSTTAAIVSGATLRGKKALAIETDQQGNLANTMRADPERPGLYELLTKTADALEVTQHTEQGDIIPAGPNISAADTVLKGRSRLYGLREGIRPIKSQYDVVVIDTPPSMNTAFLNALCAADRVIIPCEASAYGLQGLALLIDTIKETQHEYNTQLHIAGILFTMYSGRTNAARTYTQLIERQAKKWRVPVFNTRIRKGIAMQEAQIYRESIFTYAPKSNPGRDYADLLDELKI